MRIREIWVKDTFRTDIIYFNNPEIPDSAVLTSTKDPFY